MDPTSELFRILDRAEGRRYGPGAVSQRAHALQCATLAEQAGASPSLVAAALFHDIGHLIHVLGDSPAEQGVDDRHEISGDALLSRWFGPDTCMPVRLHVQAKRYLCAVEAGYFDRLSQGSQRSLALQGGVFASEDAAAFISCPHAAEAVQLRRWDDAAKRPGLATPELGQFRSIVDLARRR